MGKTNTGFIIEIIIHIVYNQKSNKGVDKVNNGKNHGIVSRKERMIEVLESRMLAWDIMNKVIIPKLEYLQRSGVGIEIGSTIMSSIDWDNGVAISTNKGAIHVKGTGEVIDETGALTSNYKQYNIH